MGRVLEVDKHGGLTLTPDLLGNPEPHTRYVVEAQNGSLSVRPDSESKRPLGWDEWWIRWQALSEVVTAASTTDRSAVDILSEMRR